MRLPKTVYESLPYYYFIVGLVCLTSTLYVNYWYWPLICTVLGIAALIAGLVVWLKRRDYRARAAAERGSAEL